jgi:hypothetical protein
MNGQDVGRTAEPFTMAVELGKIREFAQATKSTHEAYRGSVGEAPLTPATFLMTSSWWQQPQNNPLEGLDLDRRRILHGGQEFVFHGEPPRAGDVLTGCARIDKRYTKVGKRGGAMTFLEIVVAFSNCEGRLVAETRSTIIETSKSTTGNSHE